MRKRGDQSSNSSCGSTNEGAAGFDLASLFAEDRDRPLLPGQFLFRQGEPADRVFLIRRGHLRMVRHLASGEAVVIHTGQTGDLFAEAALFAQNYHCDGQAVDAAAVASCRKAEVLRAFGASPSMSLAWIERVTQQLHAARALIELRNIRSAEERVLQHLRLRADSAGEVAFEGRLLDVAAELGLTHEAYYRALANLARSGAISRDRRRMRLSSPVHSPLSKERRQ
ncbi:Crp/Fnr family transcriptional regulator [Mesorhizobium sp. M7A.F.Ca.US.008.03.1.1]|uniref:Crp/Fnr family transcriptional regulator n=1 Tax=Mesorhizobium sp. M7A.F.Ca.US.008.03.1.1 TaxID=2496742 RepID=UPI000FCC7897|nr:Crp/Fnr family transcriptional regulator [Mesorhizobium sp. M7A.F.Ca.US.008.03.1.1]RUW60687.1 Crp/Fnr family transcriptional regulator [Mesorhizobium sp. M7A.F.Ca.US.008.03.1.1]